MTSNKLFMYIFITSTTYVLLQDAGIYPANIYSFIFHSGYCLMMLSVLSIEIKQCNQSETIYRARRK